jgi:hypothetical protein
MKSSALIAQELHANSLNLLMKSYNWVEDGRRRKSCDQGLVGLGWKQLSLSQRSRPACQKQVAHKQQTRPPQRVARLLPAIWTLLRGAFGVFADVVCSIERPGREPVGGDWREELENHYHADGSLIQASPLTGGAHHAPAQVRSRGGVLCELLGLAETQSRRLVGNPHTGTT